MNAETLKALQGSIRKWKAIVAGNGVDKGIKNCPLCKLFYQDACHGCPVRRKSGRANCINTPYENWCWSDRKGSWSREGSRIGGPYSRRCAKDEVEFLQSLLPRKRGGK